MIASDIPEYAVQGWIGRKLRGACCEGGKLDEDIQDNEVWSGLTESILCGRGHAVMAGSWAKIPRTSSSGEAS